MDKVYENKTNSPMYVAGVMVPPGEIRVVRVPDEPVAPELPKTSTLAELVAEELKKPVAALLADLPGLNDDALGMYLTLENAAETPRKSLVTALSREQMRRANAVLEAEKQAAADAAAGGGAGAAAGGAEDPATAAAVADLAQAVKGA